MSSMHPPHNGGQQILAKLGRYRLFQELTGGPLTRVFLASDSQGARLIIKALYPELATVEGIRREFMRGHKAIAKLHHPHTVPVVDIVDHPTTPYVVMQLMSGGTAQDHIQRSGPLHPITAAQIGLQLCAALAALHGAQAVHLAVKPDNVYMGIGGAPRLGSPGLPVQTRALSPQTQARAGLGYAAPEEVTAPEQLDHRADVFGLGATLYTLTSGVFLTRPGEGAVEHLDLSRVPDALRTVIARCCAARPDARFASVAQVESALRYAVRTLTEIYGSEPPRLSGPSSPPGELPPTPSHPAAPPPAPAPPPMAPGPPPMAPAPPSMAPAAHAPVARPPDSEPAHTHGSVSPTPAVPPPTALAAELGTPLVSIGNLTTQIHGVTDEPWDGPAAEDVALEAEWEPALREPAPSEPRVASRTPAPASTPDLVPTHDAFPSHRIRGRRPPRVRPPPAALLTIAGLTLALMTAAILLVAGSTMLMQFAQHDVEITRSHLYTALGSDDGRIVDWINSEFGEGELLQAYGVWQDADREPERVRHALAFIEQAETMGTDLSHEISAQRYRHTERVLRDLLEARTAHEQAVWLWHARGSSALGRIAVRLGTADEPH